MIPRLREDYPGGERLADEPPLYLFEDYLTQSECDHLIELSAENMKRAVVSGEAEGVESDGRTGGVHWLMHDETPATLALSERIADLVGLPLENAESLQVINYGPGEEYRTHYDAWVAGTDTGDRCMSRGGQRLVTCLMYLASADAGGCTVFPRLDLEVTPRPRRMLVFHNCYAGTVERHPGSLHGGMAPEAGTKWACNLWFRAGRFQDPAQPTSSQGQGNMT